MPVEEPVEETPFGGVVPGPARTEVEEGEIPAITEAVVVVLDLEEEAPAAADAPEARQVTITVGPPTTAEPEAERAPPTVGEGKPAVRRPEAGAETARKQRDEPGSSSRRSAPCPTRPRVEGPQEKMARPAPRLSSMADAGQAAYLLSRFWTAESEEEMQG